MFERRVSWIFACMVSMVHIVGSAAPIVLSHKAGAVPVLIYHEIVTDGKAEGETVISLTRFSQQMQHLAEGGYVPISMNELVRVMNGKTSSLPARPVVLTFDDGWKSVLNAVPILERYGFRASFWIITGKGIGGDYLDWSDVEALSRNPRFEVYSHTVSHPWNPVDNLLTWVQNKVPGRGLSDAISELRDSKQTLEEHLKRPIPYLAWPCGWYDETLISLARQAGYVALLPALRPWLKSQSPGWPSTGPTGPLHGLARSQRSVLAARPARVTETR